LRSADVKLGDVAEHGVRFSVGELNSLEVGFSRQLSIEGLSRSFIQPSGLAVVA
jgi:hypothetical protein